MAIIIEMPKLSDTMSVGTLVKWHKKAGDLVKNGDILAEVETDKATMELENFDDGTLLEIFVGEGDEVPIGSPLAAVGEPGEEVSAPTKPADKPVEENAEKKEIPPQVEEITESDPVPERQTAQPQSEVSLPDGADSGRILISPLAKKMAGELNLNLNDIKGTGPNGRITKKDILSISTEPSTEKEVSISENIPAAEPKKDRPPYPTSHEDRLIPVSKMRSIIAQRLLESKNTIPHFYLQKEINATPLKEARIALNIKLANRNPNSPTKLTLNDVILKACAETISLVPEINSSWEEKKSDYTAEFISHLELP